MMITIPFWWFCAISLLVIAFGLMAHVTVEENRKLKEEIKKQQAIADYYMKALAHSRKSHAKLKYKLS